MANDVVITGSRATAKVRNPWLVLLFAVLTFGIYLCFWWYFANREMADLGRARGSDKLGDSPGTSVLAYTLGGIVVIPQIWTIVSTTRRVQAAQRTTIGESFNGWIAALLWIGTFGFGCHVYLQFQLNKVWRSAGMRPTEGEDAVIGDRIRAQKLAELRAAGALTEAEHDAEMTRLGLGSASPR